MNKPMQCRPPASPTTAPDTVWGQAKQFLAEHGVRVRL
jgi:hypothetical protein